MELRTQCDNRNTSPLAAYAKEIYENNRARESKTQAGRYMHRQSEIEIWMRQKLIDWLIDLHMRFQLEPETLFLGINCLDRFLSKESVHKNNFQLVGCAALRLSSKYEEIYPPDLRDLLAVSENKFQREQVLVMEKDIL